ncbi:hypothetical protein DFH09DRAFT_1097095 [Mycena vulgaris]|nr:hypothetical protein DFH09DRAFT_1097095 [Mycena vulgaris]
MIKQQTNGKCQVKFDKISSREGGELQAARLIGLIVGGSGSELMQSEGSLTGTADKLEVEETECWRSGLKIYAESGHATPKYPGRLDWGGRLKKRSIPVTSETPTSEESQNWLLEWIRSSTEALSSRTCLVLEPRSVAHRPAPSRPFRSDLAVKLAMDLKTDLRSVLALEGRPDSAAKDLGADLRRGERQVQSVNQVRLGSGGQAVSRKDTIQGCIVPAPRRGGSIRNENYRAHAAKTSCDTSLARRNGSSVEWMLQLGSSKRAQRRRLSWMGMLQCFERGYEVTPRRNARQPSFVMRNRTHLADQGKGYQAARVESELTSHPGGRSLALQSPMTGAVESRGTSFRDETRRGRITDARGDWAVTRLSMKYPCAQVNASGYQNWTRKSENQEREQGAVHSHATHLKWRHESSGGMRGRAASKWLSWEGRIELSQARSQTCSEYEEYEEVLDISNN